MKQLQFYKYAAFALLFLNIAMVVFYFLIAPPLPPKGVNDREKTTNILKLDKEQRHTFQQSAKQHQELMRNINKKQQNLLESYFHTITDTPSTTNKDTLLLQIRNLEEQKIQSTYQHFEDIKVTLKGEQQTDFKLFIDHALKRILAKDKKKPPHPKEN